jgi:hypothetical protein
MILDHTVYPDLENPPDDLPTPEDKADYVHRICSAMDFGIFPEETDWELFRGWKDVFDRFPLPHSTSYHTFRAWYRWESVPSSPPSGKPRYMIMDEREERTDPCEGWV